MTPFDFINTERYEKWPFSVPCPECNSNCSYTEDKTKTFTTHSSELAAELGNGAPDDYNGTLFGECRCNNSDCQESVHFIGSFTTEYDAHENKCYTKYIIRYFYPAVPLIKIPPATPAAVVSLLKRSFAPAFMDQSASGNLLRSAIEVLLTERKVPRFIKSKGKMRRYSLHERIQLLPKTLVAHKDSLLAIKWIGNSASHDDLDVQSLRLAFEIVQQLLEELFGTRKRDLERAIKIINKRKKP